MRHITNKSRTRTKFENFQSKINVMINVDIRLSKESKTSQISFYPYTAPRDHMWSVRLYEDIPCVYKMTLVCLNHRLKVKDS